MEWNKAVTNALGGKAALSAALSGASGGGASDKSATIPDIAVPGTGGNGSTWEDVPGATDILAIPAFSIISASFYAEVNLPADPGNASLSLNSNWAVVMRPVSGAWEAFPGLIGSDTPVQLGAYEPTGVTPDTWVPVIANGVYAQYVAEDVEISLQASIWSSGGAATPGTLIRNARVDALY